MLYTVQAGETLNQIAGCFGTVMIPLLIPVLFATLLLRFTLHGDLDLPKSGGGPHYLVLPEDTLHCLAERFTTSVSVLRPQQPLKSPAFVQAYSDQLAVPARPDIFSLSSNRRDTPFAHCTVLEHRTTAYITTALSYGHH